MPVRSSSSSVLRWPDRETVHAAFEAWARSAAKDEPALRRAGYFGSYARDEWGVGSDLDVVLVVDDSDRPFTERGSRWDLTSLPVPAQPLVYTVREWRELTGRESRFARVLDEEVVWVHRS